MKWQIGTRRLDLTNHSQIMGILNITPDSFSDGGCYTTLKQALKQADRMIEEGAAIIDIGGESTRPGATPVDEKEEQRRVLPIIHELKQRHPQIFISIDTFKSSTAEKALKAGADIINDITGFTNQEMIDVVKENSCGLIVMHMKGTPQTMQKCPTYHDVINEVSHFFSQQYLRLTQEKISPSRLCFDPGIGFGKTLEHNIELIKHLDQLDCHGCALMMALSRKKFLTSLLNSSDDGKSPLATASATIISHLHGARLHRVHDVKACHQALLIAEKLTS